MLNYGINNCKIVSIYRVGIIIFVCVSTPFNEKEGTALVYIPLSRVKVGMTLAQSICASDGLYSLLEKGQVLTESIISKLSAHNVDGIYIECKGSEDVEPKSIIRPEAKQQLMSDFRSIYVSYYNKPFISPDAVNSTRRVAESIVLAVLEREEFLADVMEIKSYDNYTYSHSLNVCILSTLIAIEMGITRNRLEDLALCALMHDVGKIDIPIEIINKSGPVTDLEFDIIKTHPEKGVERLRKCYNISREILQGVLGHHEKFDGTGYPYGSKGKHISLFARVLSVADVYDALTSQRSYRKPWPPNEALEYIIAGADSQFDFDVVQIFMHIVCAYPTGMIVTLSDESPALVIKNHPENVLRPRVRLIADTPLGNKGYEVDLFEDARYLHLTIVSIYGEDGCDFDLSDSLS